MTRIHTPCAKGRIMEHGERSIDFSVLAIRNYADHLRGIVAAIDSTTDHEFKIDLVKGHYVQHHIRNIQPGKTHAN